MWLFCLLVDNLTSLWFYFTSFSTFFLNSFGRPNTSRYRYTIHLIPGFELISLLDRAYQDIPTPSGRNRLYIISSFCNVHKYLLFRVVVPFSVVVVAQTLVKEWNSSTRRWIMSGIFGGLCLWSHVLLSGPEDECIMRCLTRTCISGKKKIVQIW